VVVHTRRLLLSAETVPPSAAGGDLVREWPGSWFRPRLQNLQGSRGVPEFTVVGRPEVVESLSPLRTTQSLGAIGEDAVGGDMRADNWCLPSAFSGDGHVFDEVFKVFGAGPQYTVAYGEGRGLGA
jgi:hypothetical protein